MSRFQAFEKAKSATGLTADEASQQILDLFPKSEAELGGKANLRLFVAYAGAVTSSPQGP